MYLFFGRHFKPINRQRPFCQSVNRTMYVYPPQLVEEYTGQWHVPLPQLKVLRTALSSFTKATAAFPDDCQHIHYVLSSMALSFFELMLFFSKEEFVEEPLKDILDSFQGCHAQLLRHRNSSLQHVKQVIKAGGPWENPVLQGILKEVEFPQNDVENYLGAEPPVFLELRVRYLQACEKLQEAMALSKSCLENPEAGKHLYFHQAYLTCLYKASLHEHLHKEVNVRKIDGRDAVEIICNTESVEKDELLLSLCKVFLTQQLQNGDMYYIWDLVFVWSRLYLRAHPSRQGFLSECLKLASSATNVRAIFPFIKLVTAELGSDGVQVCVELCARALQLCDNQADALTQSLVCKTIAFLLPHDLEICRACALLVFCQERSLEAYRTVCLLYKHPDQEPHPHNSPVRTCVRFHIVQMLKERLCFDPEFWNLLTLRTHCLELMHDTVMKAVVLNEMKEEEEKRRNEELLSTCQTSEETTLHSKSEPSEGKVKRTWKEKVLRSQKYGHIWHHCNFCHKDYKGLNVLRHALAHLRNLRSKKHRCILCEKCFNQFAVAKKHILEHINTMCKEIPHDRKQCEACTLAPKKSVQKVCTKLAKCVQSSSETHKETQISVSNDQNPEQKPRGKVQVASLSREERIVRNARHLIRKTSVSHKRHKESDTNTSKPLDLKNEQFVIKDDLLIVKHPTGMEEEDGGDLPAGENGHSVDMMFYLCPSESCDKLFIKPSGNLTKHALKCHIDDEKVLEKTFVLDKHKCTFCPRKIQFLQHYKDHMKLHGSPPRYFCYHFECNLRFLTHHELKDHIHTHQPLTPQCLFTACEKLFPNIQSLHDHEWRHYIPVPKRNELEGRQSNQTDEAPWKQKVKVEEVWLKNKKEKDSPTLCEVSNFQASQEMNKTEASEVSTSDVSETIATPDNCVQTSLDIMDNSNILNGIEGEKINSTDPSVSTHSKKACKDTLTKSADEGELIDISLSDSTGMFGEINAKIVEANISEHKSFKPENSNYGGRVKGPFMRPPASSYLNESLLSMRKRRLTEESPPKKYLHWTQKNKKEPEPVKEEPAKDVVPEQKVRHRCDKCLSSFSTLEDLQKHQALNTCSSLFGFDSDDESK
uniref:C2H2-type domain-containing protein n=1 Tax=Gouania willdenowi TaxID=441366 RepID=A0A8C5NEF2_GOUWI